MAMVINTNMGAINAVRILDGSGRDQATSMERLTSGLRINKAADDAAGLAVVTGMTTQIRGTDMAIRNANDTVGMIQTMDGATEEVVNMLQRMRELGIQSMNGTYNMSNRMQMQAEVAQIQTEIIRVADTTKFNGMHIMNSSSFGRSGAITKQSVFSIANAGWSAGNRSGAFKAHVGWETGSANQIQVLMLDFKTLSSLSGITLFSGGLSTTYASAFIQAKQFVSAMDADLEAIKTMRAYWGAIQNRLDYTVSNLQNVNENIAASKSRIMDADFAKESANLARIQVLQQAGMTMLSQANKQSQQVMSLLQ